MVAGNVNKDGNPAVGLGARLANEGHAGAQHPFVRSVEVIHAKEEADATGRLVTDSSTLAFAVRTGEKKTGLCMRRSYDYPPLLLSIVC